MWAMFAACFLMGQVASGLPERSATEVLEKIRIARQAEPPSVAHLSYSDQRRIEGVDSRFLEGKWDGFLYRDGERIGIRVTESARINKEARPTVYRHKFWDHHGRYYSMNAMPDKDAPSASWSAATTEHSTMGNNLRSIEAGGPLMGYLHADTKPFYETMAMAGNLTIRVDTTTISGVPCYFLEADTDRGLYQVWVDPARGYNLRRAKIVKEADDIGWADRPISELAEPAEREEIDLYDIRIENLDGIFVIMEATSDVRIWDKGLGRARAPRDVRSSHIVLDQIEFDPDFEALDAFEIDAPEGTLFYDLELKENFALENGELVPYVLTDERARDALDKNLAKLETDEGLLPGQENFGKASQEESVAPGGRSSPPPVASLNRTWMVSGLILTALILASVTTWWLRR